MADLVLMPKRDGGVLDTFQRCFLLVQCAAHVCPEIRPTQTHVPKDTKVQRAASAQTDTEFMAARCAFLCNRSASVLFPLLGVFGFTAFLVYLFHATCET